MVVTFFAVCVCVCVCACVRSCVCVCVCVCVLSEYVKIYGPYVTQMLSFSSWGNLQPLSAKLRKTMLAPTRRLGFPSPGPLEA